MSAVITETPAGAHPAPVVGAGSVAGALGSLALVLVLIVALGWVARRLRDMRGARGKGELQLLGGVAVGGKERIVVVQFGNDQLVVGVAPGNVTLLQRYPGIAAAMAKAGDAAETRSEDFADTRPSAVVIPFADKLRALLRQQELS